MDDARSTTDRVAADVEARRERLSRALLSSEVDALVVCSESTFTYLTGYQSGSWANKTWPLFLVFLPGQRPSAVVGAGEVDSIELDGGALDVVVYSTPSRIESLGRSELDFVPHAYARIAALLRAHGVRRLGIEESLPYTPGLPVAALREIQKLLPAVDVVDAAPTLSFLRRRKSELEIEFLGRAATVLARSYELFERDARPGLTERELRRAFLGAAAEAGADQVGYTGVIADARRASLGGPSDRAWRRGDLLMFDACIEVDGYWADFCRVFASAKPTSAQMSAYDELVEALTRTRESVRPGVAIGDLARALTDGSDGPVYGRSGHGIGLSYTEPPSLHVAETAVTEPGMVLCLEPNRAIPGVGNLTAEEEVVVTEDAFRLLSPPFPKEMTILD